MTEMPASDQPGTAGDRRDLSAPNGWAVVTAWLADHPSGTVGALTSQGVPTAVPASIPLGAGHRVEDRSLLDLVVADDAPAVTQGFLDALQHRASVRWVHLDSEPERVQLLHYFDMRDECGVVLRLMCPAAGDTYQEASSRSEVPAAGRPRVGFMTKDEVATITSVDDATCAMLGWSPDEMVGRRTLDFIHPDDHRRAIDNWMARNFNRQARVSTVRLRYQRSDGSWLWTETSNDAAVEVDGIPVVHSQIIDISTEMATTEALRRSEGLLRRVTDTVPVGLFHLGADGGVTFINPVVAKLLGDGAVTSSADLLARLAPGHEDALAAAVPSVLADGTVHEMQTELAPRDGVVPVCQVTLSPVTEGSATVGVLGSVVNVTQLRHVADHDELTGLENRSSIMRAVRGQMSGRTVSVIFVDLDQFKPINDHHGHELGDQVLEVVADRLRSTVRAGDRIGRLGGDEFLIVCPDLDEPMARQAADRIRGQLDFQLHLDGVQVSVQASVGFCFHRADDPMTATDLVAAADADMYRDKRRRQRQRAGGFPSSGRRPVDPERPGARSCRAR